MSSRTTKTRWEAADLDYEEDMKLKGGLCRQRLKKKYQNQCCHGELRK